MPHPIGQRIEGVPTATAALVGEAGQGPVGTAVLVTSLAEFQATFGGPHGGSELLPSVAQFFRNGGRRAHIVRSTGTGAATVRGALAALDSTDDVGLLCVPGVSAPRVVRAGAAYAHARGALFIADPAGSDAATIRIVEGIDDVEASHATMYFPRIEVSDPVQPGATRTIGPSGTVAGILARTDIERGVWAAAAGTEARLQGAVAVSSLVDQRGAAVLADQGINAIREISGHGIVLWGARTTARPETNAEWRYVPVRRTALFIEASVRRGLGWTVFEPNDEPTWTLARGAVAAFLDDVRRDGAFAGSSSSDTFYVRCGFDTMTQADLDAGTLVVEVGFAPLRPAEFVSLRVRIER